MSNSPFDFLNSICETKVNLLEKDHQEKDYVPFLINKGLSYHIDTVLLANETNYYYDLPKRMQYEFHLNAIRKRPRRAKWAKRDEEQAERLELLGWRYGLSRQKALEVLDLLTDEQFTEMKKQRNDESV